MSQKESIFTIIAIIVLLIVIGVASYLFLGDQKQVVCTMDAKICPDGSAVGRTGPNCEFAACPEITPESIIDEEIENSNIESYTACGCGCCSDMSPKAECLYHSKGDDIKKIIEQDMLKAQSSDCAVMGCSLPVVYSYCD